MLCVDVGENFQTHIYLQNFASMQPRTSTVKFAASRAKPTAGPHQAQQPADDLNGHTHEAVREGAFVAYQYRNSGHLPMIFFFLNEKNEQMQLIVHSSTRSV